MAQLVVRIPGETLASSATIRVNHHPRRIRCVVETMERRGNNAVGRVLSGGEYRHQWLHHHINGARGKPTIIVMSEGVPRLRWGFTLFYFIFLQATAGIYLTVGAFFAVARSHLRE